MRKTVKFFVLLVAIVALAVRASAYTITLDSSSSTTNYIGFVSTYGNTPSTTFSTSDVATGTARAASQVTNTSGWTAAIAGSEWVSNNSNAGPATPDTVEPYGYYTYTETFTVSSAMKVETGSLSIMADDTAAVLLNGQLIQGFEALGSDSDCATGGTGITCSAPYTINLTGLSLVAGTNTLTIVDLQAGTDGQGDAEGIDYYGTITNGPEPGTWVLLGSGLLVVIVMARRRIKPCPIRGA